MSDRAAARQDASSSLKTGLVWLVGHASRFLPIVVMAIIGALTWQAVRQVHPRDVVRVLRSMQAAWVAAAAALTALNIGVMGLYDVLAFRHTRAHPGERWKYGAVAFAWSNFLTLGPFAGPAIRFWLYKRSVEHRSDLESGVLSISIAFAAGLGGWTMAALVAPESGGVAHATLVAATAAAFVYALVFTARLIAFRIERFDDIDPSPAAAVGPAVVGWLDWFLASLVFAACLRSTGAAISAVAATRSFFFGQAIGLASLIPGGFGSSDAFWIAHLPVDAGIVAAALVAYRLVYYIVPWAAASLDAALVDDAACIAPRRAGAAPRGRIRGRRRRPDAHQHVDARIESRLDMLEKIVPLPIVEVSHVAAALTGMLLLVLARGLAKGYRAALGATIGVLLLAAVSSVLKGLDFEEA